LERDALLPQKPRVLSTTAIIGDLVKRVGGAWIEGDVLIVGEIDPHSYELVKGDDEKIALANALFYHGLGLEHGASLHYQLQHHPHAISLGEAIRSKSPDGILYRDGQIDPHVWMDVSLWSQTVDPVVEVLKALDPEHGEIFELRGEEVKREMAQADLAIYELLHSVPKEDRYLVTSHDAFNYFARRYLAEDPSEWMERFRAPEGLAPDGQLSSRDIQGIIDHLHRYRIGVVFPESNVSRDSLRKIVLSCRDKGHTVKICDKPLHADTLGPPGSSAETYLGMMHGNALLLFGAWAP
jgi:manganese/zinc/iron transport system substrate-binding protein